MTKLIVIFHNFAKERAYKPPNKLRGADKSLARPERKQVTATEDFDVHISYLLP